MKWLFLVMLIAVGCGRDNDNNCRSTEEMQYRCQAENIPTYGRSYSQRVCSEQYVGKRCW